MAASVEKRQFHHEHTSVRSFSPNHQRSDSPIRYSVINQGFTSLKKPAIVYPSDTSDDDEEEVDYRDVIRKTNSELESSIFDPRDVGTADQWIERNPSMVRLTGKHPFNSEPPLNKLMQHGFITPAPLHYVRNHGPDSPNHSTNLSNPTMSTHRQPPKPMDLELTIISAKHLKNVNWRNGDLTPYVIFWIEPNRTLATKADDSNNTKPVWNERFVIPIQPGPNPVLTLEVFHSKPSDTNKPLVGSLRVPLDDVINGDGNDAIRSFDLIRRSGRPNGKIRLKMNIRQRVVDNYQFAPQGSYYYTNAPPTNYGRYPPYNASPSPSVPPSPVTAPSQHSCNYRSSSDPYSGYYHGGYYAPPPPPPLQTSRPFADRPGGYGGPSAPVDYVPPPPPPAQWPGGYGGGVGGVGVGPSAPVDYVKLPTPPLPPQMPRTVDGYGSGVGGGGGGAGPSAPVDYAQYDQKQKSGKIGLGVGAVVGGMSGLSIDDGSRYEEEKVVESELNAREMDDYSDYRRRVDY